MAVELPQPIVTARYGVPESWKLQSYLDNGGYEGLRKALRHITSSTAYPLLEYAGPKADNNTRPPATNNAAAGNSNAAIVRRLRMAVART